MRTKYLDIKIAALLTEVSSAVVFTNSEFEATNNIPPPGLWRKNADAILGADQLRRNRYAC